MASKKQTAKRQIISSIAVEVDNSEIKASAINDSF